MERLGLTLLSAALALGVASRLGAAPALAPLPGASDGGRAPLVAVEASADLEPASGALRCRARLTARHPGGAGVTCRFRLGPAFELAPVRWRGCDLPRSDAGDVHEVTLPYQSTPADLVVEVRYRGTLERPGRAVLLTPEEGWLPRSEDGSSTLDLALRTPPGHDLVATVPPASRSPAAAGGLRHRLRAPAGHALSLAVGPWQVETLPAGDVRVELAASAPAAARRALPVLGRAVRSLEFLLPAGGGERGMSFVADVGAGLPETLAPGLYVAGDAEALSTEASWCRAAVRLLWSTLGWRREPADQWLLEGLVEYAALSVLEGRSTSDAVRAEVEQAGQALKRTRPAPSWRRWRGRPAPGKERGFALVLTLRGLLGREGFGRLLRDFAAGARTPAGAGVTEFRAAAERALGSDGAWLFGSLFMGGFLPDLSVDEVAVAEQRRPTELLYDSYGRPSDSGRYVCEIRLLQTGEVGLRGRVGLRIETDVEKLDTDVRVKGRLTTVQVITARPPRRVTVDPGGWLIEANEANNVLAVPPPRQG